MFDSGPFRDFAPLAHGVRYLFVDFNAYFASVEQHDDPSLRGKPVLVTPLASEHSGAIAASYEAKALGISRGTPIVEARRLCPAVIVRPARHHRYVEVHEELMREIGRHLPITRVYSIDECLCRLSRDETPLDIARAKAREIKRGIANNVGPALQCSIGLASSPLLAKLASELEKPDGLQALPMAALPAALADLPLRAIPGIGHGIKRRLAMAGVTDFGRLWRLEPRHAREIWGSVEGERFIYGLLGHDLPMTQEARAKRMIGHSRVLSGQDRRPERARIVARALLLKAATRLRSHGLHTGALHASVRFYPEGGLARDAEFRSTRNSWRLLEAFDGMWADMMAARQASFGRRTLKMVTVYLHHLSPSPPERDLFVPVDLDLKDARQAGLWERIDHLNRRFGRTKIWLASQSGLDLNYLGVKIAFSRIPERSEFV